MKREINLHRCNGYHAHNKTNEKDIVPVHQEKESATDCHLDRRCRRAISRPHVCIEEDCYAGMGQCRRGRRPYPIAVIVAESCMTTGFICLRSRSHSSMVVRTDKWHFDVLPYYRHILTLQRSKCSFTYFPKNEVLGKPSIKFVFFINNHKF